MIEIKMERKKKDFKTIDVIHIGFKTLLIEPNNDCLSSFPSFAFN